MIDLSALSRHPFPIKASEDAVRHARAFALLMWQERHDEKAAEWKAATGSDWTRERPADLSSSCKFTSLFAAVVFGGEMKGNYDHQFAAADGKIIDLNAEADDVKGRAGVHEHDPDFFWSPDHLDSLRSCLPRVERWLAAYSEVLQAETAPSASY